MLIRIASNTNRITTKLMLIDIDNNSNWQQFNNSPFLIL